jgi:hypothetical protein
VCVSARDADRSHFEIVRARRYVVDLEQLPVINSFWGKSHLLLDGDRASSMNAKQSHVEEENPENDPLENVLRLSYYLYGYRSNVGFFCISLARRTHSINRQEECAWFITIACCESMSLCCFAANASKRGIMWDLSTHRTATRLINSW